MTNSHNTSATQQEVDIGLRQSARNLERLHIPKVVAAGFELAPSAYHTGDAALDFEMSAQLLRGSNRTLEGLKASTDVLYATAPPAASIPTAADFANFAKGTAAKISYASPEDPKFDSLRSDYTSDGARGLERSSYQILLHGLERVFYFHQSPQEAHEAALLLSPSIVPRLGISSDNKHISIADMHEGIQRYGQIDYSRHALNRRFRVFEQTTQASILDIMGRDLALISGVDNQRRNSAAYLFSALLSSSEPLNLTKSIKLLDRISAEWMSYSGEEEHSDIKEFLGTISLRASNVSVTVQERLEFFTRVYDSLKFRPPRALARKNSPAKPRLTRHQQEQAQVAEERASRLAELDTLLPSATEQITEFNQRWSLSSKGFKTGGYQNIRRALIGEDATHNLPPEAVFTKGEARHFIDVLAVLKGYLEEQSTDEIITTVEAARVTADALQQQADYFNGQLHQLKPGAPTIEGPRPIGSYLDLLGSQWDSLGKVIAHHWPGGVGFAEALKSVVMPVEAQPEEPVIVNPVDIIEQGASQAPLAAGDGKSDESKPGNDLQPEQLEELDLVILPAEPSDKEIVRELERLKVEARDLSPEKIARFKDFLELREQLGGQVKATRGNREKGTRPNYVLSCQFDGKRYTIIEPREIDRATYIVAEHLAAGTAEELLALYKRDARQLGAHKIEHKADGTPHHERILAAIFELHNREF